MGDTVIDGTLHYEHNPKLHTLKNVIVDSAP